MTRCYIVEKFSQMGAGLVTKDEAFFPIWETGPFAAAYPSASILARRLAAAPSKEIVGRVRNLAGQIPSVWKVEKCYVRKMGFDYFVDIHIEVDGALSVTEGRAHPVKSKLLESNLRIKDGLVHVGPQV